MNRNVTPRGLKTAFALSLLVCLVGGGLYYRAEQARLKKQVSDNLMAVARYKVEQIVAWRAERLGDADILMRDESFAETVRRFIRDTRGNAAEAKRIRARFVALRGAYHYSNVMLLDRAGQQLFDLTGSGTPLDSLERPLLESALVAGRPLLDDLRAGPGPLTPHLDIVVPIVRADSLPPDRSAALVVLRMDADQFLYPLVQSWPTSSRSAETLIIRREDDSALFLNELRHVSGAAFKLRIPVSRQDVPAAMALRGQKGVVEGNDYRGVPVLAVIQAIPDSPWFMISKIDRSEALAEWRALSWLILSFLSVLATALVAAALTLWQRNAKVYYRDLYQTEQAWRVSEERYRITLMGVGDGVISTDARGCVELLNPVAESMTGWTQSEARGRPLEEVFRIVNEYSREPVDNPVRLVLSEGLVVGLANHTSLIARDGSEHPIADSGAPIRDADGKISGVVLVFRDQTDERRARQVLQQSESKFRSLYESMSEGLCLHDLVLDENGRPVDYRLLDVNPMFETITGLKKSEVVGRLGSAVYGTEVVPYLDVYARVAMGGSPTVFETYFPPMDKYFNIHVYSPGGGQFATVFQDISARKKAEMALHSREILLQEMGRLGKIGGWEFDVETLAGTWTEEVARIHDLDPRDPTSVQVGLSVYQGQMRQKIESAIDKAIHNAEPYDLELEMFTPAGNRKWVRTIGQPVMEDGKVVKLRGSFQDITGRKLAEEKSREDQARLDAALSSMTDAVFISDVEGRFTVFNDAFATFHRFRDKAECARNLAEYPDILEVFLASGEPAPLEMWAVPRALRGETVTNAEYRLKRKDTGETWVGSYSFSPIRDKDGVIIGSVVVGRDITEIKKAEKKLRESESRFRDLFETMTSGVAIYTSEDGENFYFSDLNPAGEKQSDVKKQEILGREVREIFPGLVKMGLYEVFRRVWKSGDSEFYPMTCYEDDRVSEWVENRVFKISKQEIVAIYDDVSERKKAAVQLEKNEKLLSKVFDILPVGLWLADGKGNLVRSNMMGRTIWGAEPLVGQEPYGVFKGRRLPSGQEIAPHEWALVRAVNQAETILDEMLEIDAFDGKKKIILNHAAPVLDDSGRVEAAIVVNQDITERIRSAEELRKSEEKISSILNDMLDAIYSVDARTDRLLQTNPSISRIFGRSMEDFYTNPKLYQEMVQPDDRPVIQQSLEELERDGRGEWSYRIVRPDGEVRWVAQRSRVVSGPDGVRLRIDSYFTDITEHKKEEMERERLEEQLIQAQKMESVGRLAGGVAHDFNNMLQTILGFTDMAIQDVPAGTALHESLQEIYRAAQRSNDLTRQLLAFARRQTIDPRVLDLNDTISAILKLLRRLIGEDIDLLWAPGRDIWKLKIDPSQIDQLLANLIVNARDAITGVGKITIETNNVTVDDAYCADHKGFAPGNFVKLTVSDNGCGMSKETLMHVFEPFFTTKGMGHGTGLGLATVYGIVKQNNGFINVYSEPGQGTTFKIYLPRCESEILQVAQPAERVKAKGGDETVLLVEDEETILNLNRKILERLGYNVLTAGGPIEAIRLTKEYEGHINLLITDVVMPDMNGRDLSQRILELKPGMKCLFTSGYTANVIAHHGVLDQGVNFIQKPFAVNDLARKIRETLDVSGQ
ncbi:PAS domain S-box protein [bacterium]|nr:PAS domain S-box protein [bacterium]